VDSERVRGSAEIAGRALHRTDDVFLFELFLGEVQADAVGQKFIDDLLKLPVQVHDDPPREKFRKRRRGS
jgi:hypothetical protein